MGWLSRLLGGGQVAAANGAQAPWQTPPIVPPQQNQPQPLRVDAPVMQPIGQPAPAPQQSSPMGLLGRFLGGAQPQQSATPGAPQAPTIRSNPLTFALGGQNALNSMFQNQLAGQAERRSQQTFDMQQTQFGWQNEERRRAAERRQRAAEFIASRPESERAELSMIDPDELGDWLQNQRQFGLQERQMELQLQEMRDNRAYRGASLQLDRERLNQDRIANSAASVLGREEAQRLGGDIERLRNWSIVDNDMAALEEILGRNPAAFNNLMEADVEQALARIRDPQTRRDVQTIYSIGTSMAREELRGQTPVSNIDLLSAIRSGPSPSSGSAFARDWLNRAYQDRSELESYVQGAIGYMQQPDGSRRTLFEADPQTGRNFYQGEDFRRYTGRDSFGAVAGNGSRSGNDEAAEAARALAARRTAASNPGAGNVGGRANAPRLLREPQTILERQAVSEYNTALQRGQTERARQLEVRLRRAGLVP